MWGKYLCREATPTDIAPRLADTQRARARPFAVESSEGRQYDSSVDDPLAGEEYLYLLTLAKSAN